MSTEWRNNIINCLDMAKSYYNNFGKDSEEDFQDIVVNYLCGIREPFKKAETEEKVAVVKYVNKDRNPKTDKSLSGRFKNMLVYIEDEEGNMIPKSIASIIPSNDNKCKDLFKMASSGVEFNQAEYLNKFDYVDSHTSKIRFVANMKVSVWMVKNWHYDSFKCPQDIIDYKRTRKVNK